MIRAGFRIARAVARLAYVRLTARRCDAFLVERGVGTPAGVVGMLVAVCDRWAGHHGHHEGPGGDGERVHW